ncbi:MAG: PD-(D/E)XK motif protein [Cyclobacteriaceae bacterium]|nr:PD-(D/E)XK motif protein [Cyclobacteriaceae bacterium]
MNILKETTLAELLLIAESKEPLNLIRYWHCIPEEKFDFNNGDERLEVKSSSNGIRVHNFSVDQLHSPSGTLTLIASIFVRQSSAGRSIDELATHISSHLANDIQLIDKLQMQIALTLGRAIHNSPDLRFDYEFAKDSLRFYRVEDIPKINLEAIPPFVSDVRFKSDISAVEPIDVNHLANNGNLFASL